LGRFLRIAGLLLLAVATWLLIAGESGWIAVEMADAWFGPVSQSGAAMLVLGLLSGLFAPMTRRMRQGRCVRCGAGTERGQTYCMDHLRQTLHEAKDRIRREGDRPRPRLQE